MACCRARVASVNGGGTPTTALLLATIAGIALVLSGSFEKLVAISAILFVVVYLSGFCALFVLRVRDPGFPDHSSSGDTRGPTWQCLSYRLRFWSRSIIGDLKDALFTLVLLALSYPAYVLLVKRRRLRGKHRRVTHAVPDRVTDNLQMSSTSAQAQQPQGDGHVDPRRNRFATVRRMYLFLCCRCCGCRYCSGEGNAGGYGEPVSGWRFRTFLCGNARYVGSDLAELQRNSATHRDRRLGCNGKRSPDRGLVSQLDYAGVTTELVQTATGCGVRGLWQSRDYYQTIEVALYITRPPSARPH